jgi:pyruvate/2-oxoglutarate dehydrogenase complex dihydrolipoamide acyltransferase (E2) component
MQSAARRDLVLPELGLGQTPVVAGIWLKRPGDRAIEGDRLLEIVADGVTVDLPAPASGVLAETLVAENEKLTVGQRLAVIETCGED